MISIDSSICFMLFHLSYIYIIQLSSYLLCDYNIAIVVTVTMNAANVNSIACVSFSVLFIVFIFISYINIIQHTSYLVCENQTKTSKIRRKCESKGARGCYESRFM